MSAWVEKAQEERKRATPEQALGIAQEHERRLGDEAELRRLEREDRGGALSVEGELHEICESTSVPELRMRRVWECLQRRDAELALSMLERGDILSVWVGAHFRGERWNGEAQAWLPARGVLQARPVVRLRRTDSTEPFVFKLKRRDDLTLGEERELVRGWSTADPATRGEDPTNVSVRVEPDSNGCFTLPLDAALTCFRQHRDSHIRSRNRRSGVEQGRPIVVEASGPGAVFTPVVPVNAEDLT